MNNQNQGAQCLINGNDVLNSENMSSENQISINPEFNASLLSSLEFISANNNHDEPNLLLVDEPNIEVICNNPELVSSQSTILSINDDKCTIAANSESDNENKLGLAKEVLIKSDESLHEKVVLFNTCQNNLGSDNIIEFNDSIKILQLIPQSLDICQTNDIKSVLEISQNDNLMKEASNSDVIHSTNSIHNVVKSVKNSVEKNNVDYISTDNFKDSHSIDNKKQIEISKIDSLNTPAKIINYDIRLNKNVNISEVGSSTLLETSISQDVIKFNQIDKKQSLEVINFTIVNSTDDTAIDDLTTETEKKCAVKENIPVDVNFNCKTQSITPTIDKNSSTAKVDKTSTQCIDEEEISCVYHLKWIIFNGRKLPIITQNENGPCPLLAICNLLLLRGNITIPPETMLIESSRLLSYLTDYIFDCTPRNISADNRLNYEQNMNDAIAIFPKLQTGLDVNVRFTGVSHFEFTTECIVFDLLNIRLFHGWLVDPTDGVAAVIGTLTYNQLVEKIICQKNCEELCGEALLAEDFLYRSASQMTYHGLCELNSTLNNDDMAVLFRNNHFLTLYKHKDEMYVLATDQGFLNESLVVWETLSNIEGDSIFLDGNLKPFRSSDPVTSDPNQIDRDFQLALSLQDDAAISLDFEEIPWNDKMLLSDHELALQMQAEEEKNINADQIPHFYGPEVSTTGAAQSTTLRSGPQLHASSSTSDVQRTIPTSQSRRSVAAGPTKEKKDSNCLLM